MAKTKKEQTLDSVELNKEIERTRVRINGLSDLDQTRVDTQIKVASEQSKLWRLLELRCLGGEGTLKEARECSREAHSWEEQKTRAIKASIADDVADLEAVANQRGKLRRDMADLEAELH